MNVNYLRTSDGIRIAYQIDDYTDPWKDADTLLLLHPAMGRMERYFSWIPHLARDYRCVRMDSRGHGLSDIPSADLPFDIDRLVADSLELLDRLGVERVHVCGCSAGGYVAQRMAMRHPERVKSIALYASTAGLYTHDAGSWIPRIQDIGMRAFLTETIAQRYRLDKVDPGLVSWFIDSASKNDPSWIGTFVLYMSTLNMRDELKKIACPTLIVYPGEEQVGAACDYEEMVRLIPDAEVRVYEGYAHNINDSAADRCANDLAEFLGRRFPAPSLAAV